MGYAPTAASVFFVSSQKRVLGLTCVCIGIVEDFAFFLSLCAVAAFFFPQDICLGYAPTAATFFVLARKRVLRLTCVSVCVWDCGFCILFKSIRRCRFLSPKIFV